MKKLNNIFSIIEKENIIIEESNLNKMLSKGLYIKLNDMPPVICIDKNISSCASIYISILAEELGHHFTTYGDLLSKSKNYSDKLMKNKKENIAKEWASSYLISDDEFVEALNNCICTSYDMCKYFDVTDEILSYKISSILKDEDKYIRIRNNFRRKEVQYEACNI